MALVNLLQLAMTAIDMLYTQCIYACSKDFMYLYSNNVAYTVKLHYIEP